MHAGMLPQRIYILCLIPNLQQQGIPKNYATSFMNFYVIHWKTCIKNI